MRTRRTETGSMLELEKRALDASANDAARPVKAGVYDILASRVQISRRLARVFALIKTRRYKLAARPPDFTARRTGPFNGSLLSPDR